MQNINKLYESARHDWIQQCSNVVGDCVFNGKRVPVIRKSPAGKKVVDYFSPEHDMPKLKALFGSRHLSFIRDRVTLKGEISAS